MFNARARIRIRTVSKEQLARPSVTEVEPNGTVQPYTRCRSTRRGKLGTRSFSEAVPPKISLTDVLSVPSPLAVPVTPRQSPVPRHVPVLLPTVAMVATMKVVTVVHAIVFIRTVARDRDSTVLKFLTI